MGNSVREQVLDRIDTLPPMPRTVAEVMRMSRTEDFSASDLAEVVCRDAVLASNVLRLCNSGLYTLAHEVTSIQKAVLLLGFEAVKNLVLSSFVQGIIREDLPGYAQTAESLWTHSIAVATASRLVAEAAAPELGDAAYTAGLIHDIGKVVLVTLLSEPFLRVVELVRRERTSFQEAENRILGTNHAEVGALVAERWQLASAFHEVIRHHHVPHLAAGDPKLSAVVNLADTLCCMLGAGAGLDGTDAALNPWSLEVLELDELRLQGVLDRATVQLLELRA